MLTIYVSSCYVFSGGHDGVVKQWDAAGGWVCVASAQVHSQAVLALAWTDGSLISSSADSFVKVTRWQRPGETFVPSASPCEVVATLGEHTQRVGALALLDAWVATGSADDSVRIWDSSDAWQCVATLTGHSDSVLVLARFRNFLCRYE